MAINKLLCMHDEHCAELVIMLMELTFHHSDETAKPIVDNFVLLHPEILTHYSIEYLYTI